MQALVSIEERQPRRTGTRPDARMAIAAALVVVVAATACQPGPTARPSAPTAATPTPTAAAAASPTPPRLIPQPPIGDLQVHPESDRVDLAMPVFSTPTEITNPLFPVSSQASVLLLGIVEDLPFRTEVTLLPETRIIDWDGQQVEVAVSQYVAYLDGEIQEVAYDLYAQDDAGNVWYFGEDVFNFEAGVIVDTHGTWIAGRDGPAAMIMPAQPAVGDVYRPENVPGLVFEEVVVRQVDKSLDGPFGPIAGGLEVEEFHMDATTEAKDFAPGYGEFYTAADGEVEALAMAVPIDAGESGVPADLAALETGARAAFAAAGTRDWAAAEAAVSDAIAGWDAYQSAGDVPRLVEPILAAALDDLDAAIEGRSQGDAQRAAIDVIRSTLDLELRHRPVVEVDRARFELWLDELALDAAAEDLQRVHSDFFSLDYVRDRIATSLDASEGPAVNLGLEALLDAIAEGDVASIEEIATQLGSVIAD
jgi:hypothetical protein